MLNDCIRKNDSKDLEKTYKKNFLFLPSLCPELVNMIKSMNWNCIEKTLTVEIIENKKFSAFVWFNGINKRSKESKSTAFADDAQKENITLVFCDENFKYLAKFTFKDITLKKHECNLGENKWDIQMLNYDNEPLLHEIVISYEKVEETIQQEKDKNISVKFKEILSIKERPDLNFIVDEEWNELENKKEILKETTGTQIIS